VVEAVMKALLQQPQPAQAVALVEVINGMLEVVRLVLELLIKDMVAAQITQTCLVVEVVLVLLVLLVQEPLVAPVDKVFIQT